MTTLTLSQPGSSDFPALFTAIGSDGQKYFYATKEYIDRGFVDDGKQTYPLFALRNPNVFDTASFIKLPSTEGLGEKAKKVYSNPTEGYLWKQSDFLKATNGAIPQPTYQITADRPAIQGMVDFQGQPTYATGATPNNDASFISADENIINYRVARQSSGGNFLSNFVNNLVGGDIGKAFASIDPSRAISRELTNLYQPVEKTISKELAQLDKDLSLSENAPLLAAIAVSVAMPGVGSAIGQQMIAAGLLPAATSAAVATAIGTGVANAALQVAQGKSAEDALKGAVVGGVAGFAGGQVGDYLVADPGAVKNFVSSTAANMVAGKDPETAAKTALVQTGIQGTADLISTAQAEKYLEKLPIPDYLNVTTPPTSADTIAIYPETNPNLVNETISDITTLPAGTVEGINATLPTTLVGDTPIDYSLTPAAKSVTVDDVVKNIVLENLDTSLQTGTLTADQIDTALNTLTGGYTLGGTTEGIKATMPDTVVTGTEPVDYTLNTITGGEGLTLPTSPNLESMGGGQGLTADVVGGVLSEEGLTRTGDVILGDPNSFINTTLPLSTDTIDTSTKTDESTDTPLTKEQVEAMIKLALTLAAADQAAKVITDATSSGDEQTQTGFPYIPSDISGWARPEYTQTWQAPLDLNSLFTTDNLLGGTQWAGLQGNQFANIPQVSMSDFISSIQNGKV
jgi:hypothetical protein